MTAFLCPMAYTSQADHAAYLADGTRKSGFTLIEMLIVLVIVGILCAMLLPAITLVKSAAGKATCASNLRQVGSACLAYAVDWEGQLPKQNPNPHYWSRPNWGQGLGGILTYIDDGRILFCVGASSPRNSLYTYSATKIAARDWANCAHFGYCYYAGCVDTKGNWTDPPFDYGPASLGLLGDIKANNQMLYSTGKVVTPAGVIRSSLSNAVLAGDAIYQYGVITWPWRTTGINHPSGAALGPGGGANVVHGDGHLEWYAYPGDIVFGGGGWGNFIPMKAEHIY